MKFICEMPLPVAMSKWWKGRETVRIYGNVLKTWPKSKWAIFYSWTLDVNTEYWIQCHHLKHTGDGNGNENRKNNAINKMMIKEKLIANANVHAFEPEKGFQ